MSDHEYRAGDWVKLQICSIDWEGDIKATHPDREPDWILNAAQVHPATPPADTPQPATDATVEAVPNISLRDYFAAKALQGLIASNDEGAGDRIDDVPGYAYDIADAMIAERDKD